MRNQYGMWCKYRLLSHETSSYVPFPRGVDLTQWTGLVESAADPSPLATDQSVLTPAVVSKITIRILAAESFIISLGLDGRRGDHREPRSSFSEGLG